MEWSEPTEAPGNSYYPKDYRWCGACGDWVTGSRHVNYQTECWRFYQHHCEHEADQAEQFTCEHCNETFWRLVRDGKKEYRNTPEGWEEWKRTAVITACAPCWLANRNQKKRGSQERPRHHETACKLCKETMTRARYGVEYCSQACRQKAYRMRLKREAIAGRRHCERCDHLIDDDLRSDARYCSPACRQKAHRQKARKKGFRP